MHSPLYTIGHGRRKIEDFVKLLQDNAIEFLIDVRTFPVSRFNPQYNQKALSVALEKENIRYVFMGEELGGRPKDPDCYFDGKIDYGLLKNKNYFKFGISRLKTAHANGNRVAIMCSESDHQVCHRFLLISKVLQEEGIPVVHIDKNGICQF